MNTKEDVVPRGCMSLAVAAIVAPFIALSAASAQTSPSTQTLQEARPSAIPAPAAPPSSQTAPAGLLGQFGASLQDAGVQFHGIFLDSFVANPHMGAYPNNTINWSFVAPTLDFDMGRIAGINGGTIHLQYTIFMLKSNYPGGASQFADEIGGYYGIPVPNSNMLSVLTWEQKLLNGRLDIEVGKSNPARYFAAPNCFSVLACISTPVMTLDADFVPFVYPLWGARASYQMDKGWYVQGGAYEDNFRIDLHNGVDWGTYAATGANILAEIGRKTSYADANLPGSYEFGGFYNTSGPGTTKGSYAAYGPATAAYPYEGGKGLFFRGQQAIWREPGAFTAATPKNISLYGGLDVSVSNPQPAEMDAFAGVALTGFIPHRPNDVLGLQFEYNRISDKEVAFQEARYQQAGLGNPTQPQNEYTLTATSHFQLFNSVALEATAAYFANTNDYYDYLPIRNTPRDGFITTVSLIVSLGTLLGTSSNPF